MRQSHVNTYSVRKLRFVSRSFQSIYQATNQQKKLIGECTNHTTQDLRRKL